MEIKPSKIISVRPVFLREPNSKTHINGKTNLSELKGKIGVYIIFEGIEETGKFEPVYVGASGMKENRRGNLYKALLRHFYTYADNINDRAALWYQTGLFKSGRVEMQERVTYYETIKDFDYYFRAYIFPDIAGKSKDEKLAIKAAISDFEREKILELEPRDNPPVYTKEEIEEQTEEVPF